MFSEKWDRRFLGLAAYLAQWSKDPSTKVGAVIVRPDKTVASLGFNGFPRGAKDDEALYADREWKYAHIIHGEVNATVHAREPVAGYALFTWPMMPCIRCAPIIIQAGIRLFVCPHASEDALSRRWGDDGAREYIQECGGRVLEIGVPKDFLPR